MLPIALVSVAIVVLAVIILATLLSWYATANPKPKPVYTLKNLTLNPQTLNPQILKTQNPHPKP